MTGHPLDEFVDLVRTRFDPSMIRLGLNGPVVTRKNTYFYLDYFGAQIGLEVLVEFDYFFVFAVVFRHGGSRTVPEKVEFGKQRLMYLQAALEQIGVRNADTDEQLKALGGDYRNCDAMCSLLVGMNEKSWQDVVANSDLLFPP
jgi:hypothetical protein